MLRWGIPQYRLPNNVLDHEIELIRRKGVTFEYNCRLGAAISLEKLRKDFDAVYIGVGVQNSRKLGIAGEDKTGVSYGIEFLNEANMNGSLLKVKDRVTVIGGGNVAVDVARTALRLGAKHVDMVSLEQRYEMPALPEEIESSLEEGIAVLNGWGPKRILGNGSVEGIELKRCTSVFDDQKRFNPAYNENDLSTLKTDQIIVAIGQALEKQMVEQTGLQIERGYLKVDPITLETSLPGIFAGGDSVTGPASVIQAVAAGKRERNQ